MFDEQHFCQTELSLPMYTSSHTIGVDFKHVNAQVFLTEECSDMPSGTHTRHKLTVSLYSPQAHLQMLSLPL